MTPIEEWLGSLGLSEYADRFAENRIDLSILRDLTDQDLKDLGVVLGDRRKILRAIAELATTVSATPPLAAASESKPRDEAERRQVTVMFSDLVGSTALATRMDPEDLREIVSAYQNCVAETVGHFSGFVAQYMGDCVLAYFGYPQAQEDDAERAVRAGLALIAAVAGLKAHTQLRTRVGIATGLVVVGDLIGSWEGHERRIVGETPNLAARLQEIAEPDTVVIAEGTRRLLGNLFEVEDLGPSGLKGFPGPVRAWAVLRPSSVESRFEALRTPGLTALVGREEESELLLRRWSKAKTSEGQVVLLSGEAGIGKSRLAVALLECLADEPHTRLRYFCSSQRTSSPLYPIIAQMERAAGLARDDAPQARLDKLDAMLAKTSTSMQDATLLAEMLSLPNDGRYPALELSPQQRRQRTLDALNLQMEALSRSSPVLMIFEDVHWIDPTSLEALGRAVDRIRSLRVLLIVTYRPDFEPPWIGRPHVTVRTIGRLAQRDVDTMIDQVVGDKPLPVSIRRDIIERTDGIPLFVEEMTKAVLETESEDEARRTAALIPSSASAIPATLHASLMARLDRLGRAKALAQIGAAIGREFSHALLAAVVRKPEAEIGSGLGRLIQAGLLYRQGEPPHATYLFKHALIQDAAYSTLLREARRALHARIAETLEGQFADIVERRPDLLARHCTEAGLIEKAAHQWGKAGRLSLDLVALQEAVAYLQEGLATIEQLPSSADRDSIELALREPLHAARLQWHGWASPEVGANATAILHLAQRQGRSESLLVGLWGMWVNTLTQGRIAETSYWAQRLLTEGNESKNVDLQILGHRASGFSHFYLGELKGALEQGDKALALYDAQRAERWRALAGNDVKTAVGIFSSQALWMLGYPDQASQMTDQLDADSRRLGHPFDIGWASTWGAYVLDYRCEPDRLLARAHEAERIGREQSVPVFNKAFVPMCEGLAMLRKGELLEAISSLERGIEGWRATGGYLNVPFLKGALAEALSREGDFETGLRLLDECLDQIKRPGWRERVWLAEILRLKGWVLMGQGRRTEAETQLRASIECARGQQAKSWELRSSTTLAQLFIECGQRDAARQLLAPIYGWFTEGFDTFDLKEAKALLDELAQ